MGNVPGCPAVTSHHLGLEQTDVFLVDKNGQLNVYWAAGGGAWNGPAKLGPAGIANPGSFVAASRQFGVTGTNFTVNHTVKVDYKFDDTGGGPTTFQSSCGHSSLTRRRPDRQE
jgi:hypothetical protein